MMSFALFAPRFARAQDAAIRESPSQQASAEMALAREFVNRISSGFKRADKMLAAHSDNGAPQNALQGRLEDGEILMLRIRLSQRLALDNPVMGLVEDGQILLSLRDFFGALELPITLNEDNSAASGWYIRGNKPFSLNLATQEAISDHGTFSLSPAVVSRDGDIFAPINDLALWFKFTMELRLSSQDILLESDVPLPVQEKLSRRDRVLKDNKTGPATLPRGDTDKSMADFPFIDVSTRSGYKRDGDGRPSDTTHTASIRTTGDFAHGTLTTTTQLNDTDYLSNLRVNYRRESLEPELLGPLQARRYEIGDLSTVRMPIGQTQQELGVRMTNIHPLRAYLRPSTGITGSTFPGWDVELYRDSQLLAFQTAGDDGIYNFENVDLFSRDNTFRVIAYGPQGEIREEEIYIPVDSDRVAKMGSAYDLSVTSQRNQTYRAVEPDDEDRGGIRVRGLFEQPFGDSSAATAGFETMQRDGEQMATLHGGLSTTIAQTLVNLNAAVDSKGESGAELVARRNFGKHGLRNELEWATDRFDVNKDASSRSVFKESLSINGPLGLNLGERPRYNFGAEYDVDSDDDSTTTLLAGVSTSWRRMAFGQQLSYNTGSNSQEDSLHNLGTVNGSFGLNRFRLITDYQIMPESKLDSVTASAQRYLQKDLEIGADIVHRPDPQLTEGRAYLNWNAGFARISPQIAYNSDRDLSATLSTRFGIARDPLKDSIRMFDRPITNKGALSTFVFLDKNGDNLFNGEDEALPGIIIQTPQNGGRIVTGEDGYAFSANMNDLRVTDIYINTASLPDPLWIPGYAGMSVLPREGHTTAINFPIHLAGEIEGNILVEHENGSTIPLRSAEIALYDDRGEKIQTALSEADGYYLISPVPPGSYLLTVTGASLQGRNAAAPPPARIQIGYDGPALSGRNLILRGGEDNIPVTFLRDLSDTEINMGALQGHEAILNLGAYKSRMLMGVTWFKLKTRHAGTLAGAALLEKPSDSNAAAKTGTATLRVALRDGTIENAHRRCAALLRDHASCSVEILPRDLQQGILKTAQQ